MAQVAKTSLEALVASSQRSHQTTRDALELAFARLRHGNPKVVTKGTSVTPTSVAKEAGVSRETLYRFHEPVLTQIRIHNDQQPREQLRQSRAELIKAKATAKELRKLVEDAQLAEEALARINHRMAARIQELEQLLHVRDQIISSLREANASGMSSQVVQIKPRRG